MYKNLFEDEGRIFRHCIEYLRPYLKEAVYKNIVKKEESAKFIFNMIYELRKTYYPHCELNWLKENERACYFFWLALLTHYIDKKDDMTLQYFAFSPTNHLVRFDAIVEVLDNPHIHLINRMDKTYLMEELTKMWGKIMNMKDPFPWLSIDDKDLCIWAWERLKQEEIACLQDPNHPIFPVDHNEMYLALYSVFYVWETSKENKEKFLVRLNRARGMKKLRTKKKQTTHNAKGFSIF